MGSEGESMETECSTSSTVTALSTCIKCKEAFSGRTPRLLTCLHTMCSACYDSCQQAAIEAVQGQEANGKRTPENKEAVIACPECKDKMRCSDTLENFLVKLVEKDDQEAKGEEEKKKHLCSCSEGDEEQEGTSFCKDCAEWLCEECVQAHRRVRLTKDHTIKSGEEALETETVLSIANESGLEICKRHPGEKSQFFCEACEMLTCRDCQLLEHKDHKYSFLNAAAESFRGKLVEHLEQLKRNKEKLVKLLGLLQQKTAQVKEEKENVLRKVQLQADMLIKKIIQAARQILLNLASVSDAASSRFSRDCNDVNSLLNKHNYAVAYIENLLSSANPCGLLHTKAMVEKHCHRLDKNPPELPSLKGQLQFQYRHNVNFLVENIHHFGCIYVNGIRYPPDKNQLHKQQQQQQQSQQPSAPGSQGPAAQAIPDRNKVILAYMMQQQQQQQQQQQPSQLGPPPLYNRGMGPQSVGASMSQRFAYKPWIGPGPRVPGSNPGMFSMSGPASHTSAQPGFTPMRLNHRPVTSLQGPIQGQAPPFPSGMNVHSTSGGPAHGDPMFHRSQQPPPLINNTMAPSACPV